MKETPDQAAHHAADREFYLGPQPYLAGDLERQRDLYVRAFLAGAQWHQQQESNIQTDADDRKILTREPT